MLLFVYPPFTLRGGPEGGVAFKAPPQPPGSREDAPAHLPQSPLSRTATGACAVPRLNFDPHAADARGPAMLSPQAAVEGSYG